MNCYNFTPKWLITCFNKKKEKLTIWELKKKTPFGGSNGLWKYDYLAVVKQLIWKQSKKTNFQTNTNHSKNKKQIQLKIARAGSVDWSSSKQQKCMTKLLRTSTYPSYWAKSSVCINSRAWNLLWVTIDTAVKERWGRKGGRGGEREGGEREERGREGGERERGRELAISYEEKHWLTVGNKKFL